jgi:hypothetical protein
MHLTLAAGLVSVVANPTRAEAAPDPWLLARVKKVARKVRVRVAPDRQPPIVGLMLTVEYFTYFRGRLCVSGWVFHPQYDIEQLAYRLPGGRPVRLRGWSRESPELVQALGARAGRVRFEFEVREPDPERACAMEMVIRLDPGYVLTERLVGRFVEHDPYHRLIDEYFNCLKNQQAIRVLEIGARNRSGNVRRDLVGNGASYVGLDVRAGENVDVVGDAHDMTALFAPESFDSVFSISTFEHLAMPWKVALEINRILVDGGTVLTVTHQTWPLHEQPWDFWRYSDNTWTAIFNEYTGFEIERVALGEAASIVPHNVHPLTVGLPHHRSMLGSAVICRKIGTSKVQWDVPLPSIIDSAYPY